MGRAKVDPKKVETALRMVRAGHTPEEAAAKVGIGRMTVYRRMEKQKAKTAETQSPELETDEDGDSETVNDGDDDLEEISRLIRQIKRRITRLPLGSPRYGPMAQNLGGLLQRRQKMRPPPPPTPEELAAANFRADSEAIELLENLVKQHEQEAAAKGVCVRCGQRVPGAKA